MHGSEGNARPKDTSRIEGLSVETLLDCVSDAVFALDANGCFVAYNAAAARFTGPTPNEVLGRPISDVLPGYAGSETERRLKQVIDLGENVTFEARSIAQPDRTIEMRAAPMPGGGLIVTFSDVTERSRTQEALRESEERFRTLADQAPVLIWISGLDGGCNWFNRPWSEFTGRTMEQEVGAGWAEGVHPDDLERCMEIYLAAFARREDFAMEYRLRRHDGDYRWILDHGHPLANHGGVFTGFIGSCIDITQQVESQEELERKVAARTAELSAAYRHLETFSYSASHDLRSPLRAISMANQLLLEDYSDVLGDDGRREIKRASDAATRMGRLIDNLLDHARMGNKSLKRETQDVGGVAQSILSEISGLTYNPDVVEVRIALGLQTKADPALLRVRLQNLIENALKFTRGLQTPLIEVGRNPEISDAFYIRDNGVGFDPSIAERLFDPFESFHDRSEYPGSGIGLSSVKRVAERHGGRVWAESGGPGTGATFYFTLS